MKTDNFIDILAKDDWVEPPRPVYVWFVGGAVTLILLTVIWNLAAGMGIRSDYFQALGNPLVLAKQALPFMLLILMIPVVKTLSYPEGEYRQSMIWPLAIYALIMAALFWFAWANTPGEQIGMDVVGKSRLKCLFVIPVYSWVVMGFAFSYAKKSAPTNPKAFSIATALASTSLAIVVYAVGCVEDTPLFYAIWYNIAMIIAVGVGGFFGYRWIKW